MSNVLVINAGSSSLKYCLIELVSEKSIVKGHYDGIGSSGGNTCVVKTFFENDKIKEDVVIDSHNSAIENMIDKIKKVDANLDSIIAVVHRVVHGGEKYCDATLIDDDFVAHIDSLSYLAPLHNPTNVECIKILRKLLPSKKQFAVFDTAFHSSIPEKNFLYGLPKELYQKFKIRKYGFHGESHKFIALNTAKLLDKKVEDLKIISCHLGNGQSITAIKEGKSFDTSMGFTPLDGLPMGTRSGSFDPEIVLFLLNQGYSQEEIHNIINKKSGLLGISGISNDMRLLHEKAKASNKDAALTINLLANRITKIIGSYVAEMNGVDAITFTAGLGENAFYLREKILKNFEYLNLKLDIEKNKNNETIISCTESAIKVFVIPTNEEVQMLRDIKKLI
jgi:acetate kinase